MIIDAKQIKGKPKKVGLLHGKDVFLTITKGGLNVISCPGEKNPTLGTGPHAGISRHIAFKHAPDLQWTNLNKSDWIDVNDCPEIVEKYDALTQALRDRESGK